MTKFKGITQNLMEEMEKSGKLVTLTKRQAFNLDNKLSMPLTIKEEFYRKSRGSEDYINNLEYRTAEV